MAMVFFFSTWTSPLFALKSRAAPVAATPVPPMSLQGAAGCRAPGTTTAKANTAHLVDVGKFMGDLAWIYYIRLY